MDASTTPAINLRTDSGGIRFRRRLAEMIEAEQSALLAPSI
jgi:hypothetical protein